MCYFVQRLRLMIQPEKLENEHLDIIAVYL